MVNLRPKISRSLRALVWNTYIGESVGRAHCKCGTTISQLSFECGHVIAVANDGSTTIDNLRPICAGCNKSMGTENMHDFFHNLQRTSGIPQIQRKTLTRYRELQQEAKLRGIRATLPQKELEKQINIYGGHVATNRNNVIKPLKGTTTQVRRIRHTTNREPTRQNTISTPRRPPQEPMQNNQKSPESSLLSYVSSVSSVINMISRLFI